LTLGNRPPERFDSGLVVGGGLFPGRIDVPIATGGACFKRRIEVHAVQVPLRIGAQP
jgi:hypothetical protein